MDVSTRSARKESVSEDRGQLVLVLPVHGADPDHAGLVAADRDLNWQYQTPEEQWHAICGRNE